MAAIAQALLSVAAIIVSAYLSAQLASLPTLVSRHQRLRGLGGLVEMAREVVFLAKGFAERRVEGRARGVFETQRFDPAISAFSSITLEDVSPGELVYPLLRMHEDLISTQREMKELNESLTPPSEAALLRLTAIVATAERLASEIDAATIRAEQRERNWWKLGSARR